MKSNTLIERRSLKTHIRPILVMSVIMFWSARIASADPQVLLEDTFTTTDPSWGFDSAATVQNGTLVIKPAINTAEEFQYGADIFTDTDISVTVTTTSVDPSSGGGILFWGQDANDYYTAHIFGDGSYDISRLHANNFLYQVPKTTSTAINKGVGAKNLLRVVTQGSKITFYINGTQVASVQGQPPTGGGTVGLFTESGTTDAASFTFQDFKVLSVQ